MTELWKAVDAFSTIWVASPHVATFREGIKPTPSAPNRPPFQYDSLHELLVTYSMFRSQLLLLGKRLGRVPEFQDLYQRPEIKAWFDVAQRFAFVLVEVIEFLRSRLPGYPRLLVPDLLAGSSRVYIDGLWDQRFPWEFEVRQARLQFAAQPAMLAPALELADGSAAAYAALADVLIALRGTDTWQRFSAADAGLEPTDREAAKAIRYAYRQAVDSVRVDDIAGETVLRDGMFRRAELARVKGQGSGRLREYLDAFDATDHLIDALAALISHRVATGPLDELSPTEASWGAPADVRRVRFKADDDEFRHTYELVKIRSDVESLAGIVLLHDLNIHWNREGVVRTALGGLLSGSADIPAIPGAETSSRPKPRS